jgi:hypothetical protein
MKRTRQVENPDWNILGQIPLSLEIEELDEHEARTITPEDARLRSEVARDALGDKKPSGYARYDEFIKRGWPWRVAAYIAWASAPKLSREPKTQEELATQILGLTSDRQIHTWRKKNPTIDETVGLMQAAPLFEHRADIFDALIKSATTKDYKNHQDRKLAFEMLGDFTPRMQVEETNHGNNDLEQLSDEELRKAARYAVDHHPIDDVDGGQEIEDE